MAAWTQMYTSGLTLKIKLALGEDGNPVVSDGHFTATVTHAVTGAPVGSLELDVSPE